MISFFPKPFFGIVEGIADPDEKQGRVQVRVYGYHTANKSLIPTEKLLWAQVALPTTSPSVSGLGQTPFLVKGTQVYGVFLDGESAQQPLITHTVPGKPKQADPSQGFNDPDGVNPKHPGESDINRLARNENIDETIVQSKKDGVEQGVETATGEWDEPVTPYAAQYPHNKVFESESGHIQEVDDTPGAERTHNYHKAGTFTETHPDGTTVTKIVGDKYEIVHKDGYLFIKGALNISVNGDSNIYVKGDVNQKVDGDVNEEVNGSVSRKVSGTYDIECAGYTVTAPTVDYKK